MITDLMDTRYLKRFSMVKNLHSSQNESVEIVNLIKVINVSYPTMKKMIDEVKMDISDIGYKNEIELVELSDQKKLILNVKKNISLNVIKLFYLEQSYRFKMFMLFLEPKKWTFSEIEQKLNMSRAMVRKEIVFLRTFIHQLAKNITLETDKKVYLRGDELTIRMLYTGVYQQVYGGYKWPFNFIRLREISQLLATLGNELNVSSTYFFLTLHFGIAVSLYRAKKIRISENKYYWKPMKVQEGISYCNFTNKLKEMMPFLPSESVKIEASFLVSCVVVSSMTKSGKEASNFFRESNELKNINFMEFIERKVSTIEDFALFEMTEREKAKATTRLIAIYYKMLLYKETLQQRVVDLYEYNPFDFPGNIERERSFYKTIMQILSENENEIEQKFVEYLCISYYKLLFFELSKHLFHPKIRILILSSRTPELLITTKLQTSEDYFYKEIVDEFRVDVDLIVSDMAISRQNIMIIPIEIPIIYLHDEFCLEDNELIQKTLSKIADKKYKQMKFKK